MTENTANLDEHKGLTDSDVFPEFRRAPKIATVTRERVAWPDRLATWAYVAIIAAIPLVWVTVKLGPVDLPLPIALFAALVPPMLFKQSFLSDCLLVLSRGYLFWLANVFYLAYLGIYSAMYESDVSPRYFAGKLLLLAGAFMISVQTVSLVQNDRFARAIRNAGILGLIAFAFFFTWGMRRASISFSQGLSAFTSGQINAYMSTNQRVLSSYQVEGGGTSGSDDVTVLKNVAGEGLAGLAAMVCVATAVRRSRHRMLERLLILLFSIATVLLLSRSAILVLASALLWCVYAFHKRQFATVLIVLAILSLGLFLLISLGTFDDAEIIVKRFETDRSIQGRLEQYARVATDRPAREMLFGSGPNAVGILDLRIHNLLLSSWVEGGIIALTCVVLQFGVLLMLVIRSLMLEPFARANSYALLQFASVSLIISGTLRTMFGGGGGYYTPPGLICLAVALGIMSCVPVLLNNMATSLDEGDLVQSL